MPKEYIIVRIGTRMYKVCCNDLRRVYYVQKKKKPPFPEY